MLTLPAIQNLDQQDENWLKQVHPRNCTNSFFQQLRQLDILDHIVLVLTIYSTMNFLQLVINFGYTKVGD